MVFTKKKIWFSSVALFILVYSINFMGYRDYFPLFLLPVLGILMIRSKLSKWFLITQIVLLAFLVCYCLMALYYGYFSFFAILGRLIYPSMFMLIGYYVAGFDTPKNLKSFSILILLITGSTLYGMFSLIKTINLYGSYENVMSALGGRLIEDLWGNSYISATVLNSSVSLGLSLLGLLFIKSNDLAPNKRILKIAILSIFLASIYTSATLGNRTGIITVIVSFFTIFLLKLNSNIKGIIRLIVFIISLYILKLLFFNLNTFGVRSYWESSFIFSRFENSKVYDDPRYEAWTTIIRNFNENLLGGRQINLSVNFAHNLWLDVFYDAGIFPLIFLVIFTIISLISLFKLLKLELPNIYKGLVIGLYTAFFLTFAVEPILQGFVVYFTFFCFLIGIIQRKLTSATY
ncbi:hypothetical protein [Priestia filamentosa]|uniref:hypothetical protein n=1 Tax=Priestia filamentosa TaxID=1402861 RepID=UPI002E24A4E3|nr:hypothetical protein [Priestia filamentosa]